MTTAEPTPDRRTLLRDALKALETMQARLEASESARREPIAVIGMSCRFPGGANDPDAYWGLLREGRDAVREVPADRWDVDEYFDADPKAPGKTTTRWGGFLDQVDEFDPRFFNISPREAVTLDPQQRLLLEVSWEALEHAGYAPESLEGSATGVFIGITTTEYSQLMRLGSPEFSDVYSATGNALNAAAGRLSFVLGLRGPSMAIDTACSSSLVAIHQACQSLRSGESRMALAGGVNVLVVPDPFILFAKWGMMARDGRCKAFDASADGFVRGEGCGVLLLKRLSEAVADGDHILAVLRGSAVNQDGHSSGLTVPNGPAQEDVVRAALANAGVVPADIDYVEAHGTGTPIGDPIELEALGAVFSATRPSDRPLVVGSVKTNLGHVEAASGVAGLIKVILSLQHQEIPQHLHFREPNPRIAWERLGFKVPTSNLPWRAGQRPRLAGVSSFGFSGTNAHVVVGEAPTPEPPAAITDRRIHVLPLSARTEPALAALAARHAERLAGLKDVDIGDVAYTASAGRAHHAQRLAITARTLDQIIEGLVAAGQGREGPGIARSRAATAAPRLAFLFTGQGSQYPDMGRQLYETEPVFRAAIDRCSQVLDRHLGRSLVTVLYPSGVDAASLLDQTAFTQPALFAVEYGLACLWQAWGIEPAAVAGHSVGEYVAACVAGVLGLEDGLELIATRARLMQQLPAGGAMAAIGADLACVERIAGRFAERLSIAALNAPQSTVISGAEDAVAAAMACFQTDGIQAKRLVVSHAFHSPLLEPILRDLERSAAGIRFAAPRLPLVSNLTGRPMTDPPDATYWMRHAREPVRFGESVTTLQQLGITGYLEVGPSPTLLGFVRQVLKDRGTLLIPSLRKGRDEEEEMARALASLYTAGAPVNWSGVHQSFPRRRLPLPTYPFERQRYWATVPQRGTSVAPARRGGRAGAHPLLGEHLRIAAEGEMHVWDGEISTTRSPYLADHKVQGVPVVPATAYVEMVLAAAAETFGEAPGSLSDIRYHKPLFLPDESPVSVQTVLSGASSSDLTFRIASRGGDGSLALLATGRLQRGSDRVPVGSSLDVAAIRGSCSEALMGSDFYRPLAERGNDWGSTFQGLKHLWRRGNEAISLVSVHERLRHDLTRYMFHPAVSDACGHVLTATQPLERSAGPRGGAFVGGSIDEVRFYRRPEGMRLWAYARRLQDIPGQPNVLVGDVTVTDETGAIVAETLGARLFYLDRDVKAGATDVEQWIHTLDFEPRPRDPASGGSRRPGSSGPWLVLADHVGVAEALVARIAAEGQPVVRVDHGRAYEPKGNGTYTIRPDAPEDMKRLVAEGLGGATPRAVVNLWSLSAEPAASMSAAGLDEALLLGCGSALHLAQGFAGTPNPPRIWFVTRNSQPAGGEREPCEAGQAPVWGFGRTLAVEHTELWGGLIDLAAGDAPGDAAREIYDEVTGGDADDQVAFREGRRYVARLARVEPPCAGGPITLRPDATYLVTGGLGGLGLEVTRWLVGKGARRLMLMGRSRLPPRREWNRPGLTAEEKRRTAAILEIEALGAAVHVVFVDVSDADAVAASLQEFREEGWPTIRGVVHAAGIMQYEPMAHHSLAALRQIAAAKARGAWILHRLLADPVPDFFVCFSSASALLSSPLLASYAAANSFLDAFAHHRRALGLTTLSVNWGLWSDVGMVARFSEAGDRAPSAIGRTMKPMQGLEALDRLMRAGTTQAAVIPVDWQEWARSYGGFMAAPFLSRVLQVAHREARVPSAPADGIRHRLTAAAPNERAGLIEAHLAERIGGVVGMTAAAIDRDQSITTLGLDSLMAVELKNSLESDLEVVVPIVQLLQGPTVTELAQLVLDRWGEVGDGSLALARTSSGVVMEEGEI